MPPPDLTADAPVLNILHPVEIGLRPAFGIEFDFAFPNRRNRRFCQLFHVAEPLTADQRFNRHIAAFGKSHRVTDRFNFGQQAELIQLCNHLFPRRKAIHTGKLDHRQIVTLPDRKVIRVMCRCDFYTAGTLFRVGVLIGNNRDFPVG